MKPIPNEFQGRSDQRAFQFKLLKREKDICLFEKTYKTGGTAKHYEVVYISKTPKRSFPDGRVVDAHETMPSPEKWGTDAWSPATLEDAHTLFDTLIQKF